MPPQQQRQYASTDPNFGQEKTYASTDPNFGLDKKDEPKKPERSTVADLGLGAAKSLGRTAADWVAFLNANPSASWSRVIPDLQNENATQTTGGVITDLALAAPQAIASKAVVGTMRQGARLLEQSAIPGLTDQGARAVLKRGAFLPTKANAAMLAAEAKAASNAPMIERFGQWAPKAPNKILDAASQAMATAAEKPWGGRITWPEIATVLGSGAMFQSPKIAAIIGTLTALHRPMVKAAGAGVLNATAPAISAVGGTGGVQVAREVFDELERQRRGGR